MQLIAMNLHKCAICIQTAMSFQCIVHRKYCTLAINIVCKRNNKIRMIGKVWLPLEVRNFRVDGLARSLQQSIEK